MRRLLILACLAASPAAAERGPPWRTMDAWGRVTDGRRAEPGCAFPLWSCGLQGDPHRALVEYRREEAAAAADAPDCGRPSGRPTPREAATRQVANLREGPGIDRPILVQLPEGLAVTVLAECGVWRRVRTDGHEGWLHTALLRLSRLYPHVDGREPASGPV